MSRRLTNANVRDFNRRVGSIPSNIVAGMFSFRPAQFFEVEETVRRAPAVDVSPAPPKR